VHHGDSGALVFALIEEETTAKSGDHGAHFAWRPVAMLLGSDSDVSCVVALCLSVLRDPLHHGLVAQLRPE
jgi:hypothetical protein